MSPDVTATLDIEDLRSSEETEDRTPTMVNLILDFFGELEIKASVFFVGDVAKKHPSLVLRASNEGHEIGLHGHEHVPISSLSPSEFRTETYAARNYLQDISNQPINGFRAPMMSVVPESSWALSIISELGFLYSSSVLPASSLLYGWPGLPQQPFLWSGGLIEFPCPLLRLFGLKIPYLGGTYLRLFPDFLRRFGLQNSNSKEILWTYCHPWEFDNNEPYHNLSHVGPLANRIAWLRRSRMLNRMRKVLSGSVGPPLGEIANKINKDALPQVQHSAFTPTSPIIRWAHGSLRE